MITKNLKIYTFISIVFSIIIFYFYFQTNKKLASKNESINCLEVIYQYYNISTDLKIYRGLEQLDYSKTSEKKLSFLSNSIREELKKINNTSIQKKLEKLLSRKTTNKEKNFTEFTSVISDIDYEISKEAEKGKLFNNNKYVINILVYDIPKLSEYIGRLRGKGASLLSSHKLLLKDKDDLKSYLLEFNQRLKDLKLKSEKLDNKKDFLLLHKKIENEIKVFSISIEWVLKKDFRNVNSYFIKGTKVIYALNEYNDYLYKTIKTKLESDIKKEQDKIKNLLLFFALIILLLSFYSLFLNIKYKWLEKE